MIAPERFGKFYAGNLNQESAHVKHATVQLGSFKHAFRTTLKLLNITQLNNNKLQQWKSFYRVVDYTPAELRGDRLLQHPASKRASCRKEVSMHFRRSVFRQRSQWSQLSSKISFMLARKLYAPLLSFPTPCYGFFYPLKNAKTD